MNILIPPIVNMPRVCDECPEDLCLIGCSYDIFCKKIPSLF